jgi:hypothetical protein
MINIILYINLAIGTIIVVVSIGILVIGIVIQIVVVVIVMVLVLQVEGRIVELRHIERIMVLE